MRRILLALLALPACELLLDFQLAPEALCHDQLDNDLDGFTDCDDSDCSADLLCAGIVCGDGIVAPPEVCDDGNTRDGDGCRADCFSVDNCGDAQNQPLELCLISNNTINAATATAFTIGDIDGDEDRDLLFVTNEETGGALHLERNNSSNDQFLFSPATPVELGTADFRAIAVGNLDDLDGDDVAIAAFDTGEIHLFSLVNEVLIEQAVITTNTNPSEIFLTDLNNDDLADLIVVNRDSAQPDIANDTVQIFLNEGSFVFSTPQSFSFSASSLVAEDIDQDSDKDILFVNETATGSKEIILLIQNVTNSFVSQSLFAQNSIAALAVGDMDGDLDNDILFASTVNGSDVVTILRNNQGGQFAFSASVNIDKTGIHRIVVGNIDQDATRDIVLLTQDSIHFFLNDFSNGDFVETRFENIGQPSSLLLDDIDDNGQIDALFLDLTTGAESIVLLEANP